MDERKENVTKSSLQTATQLNFYAIFICCSKQASKQASKIKQGNNSTTLARHWG